MAMVKRALPAAALLLGAGLAACSDPVGPGDVNAQLLAANVSSLSDVFATNAAFTSMQSLGVVFPPFAGSAIRAAAVPLGALQRLPAAPGSPRFALRALAGLRVPGEVHALFPANVLGKTFEWDAINDVYVEGTAPGAPANGIRIRLYLVDPGTGMPFEPVQQIGYVDLTDEPTPQAEHLGVLIRLFTVTVAQYYVEDVTTTTASTLRGVGYFKSADGTRQANFDLNHTERLVGTQLLDYSVTGDDGTFVRLLADVDSTSGDFDFAVGQGRNSIAIEVSEAGGMVSGSILFNGTAVATISGDAANPTFTGANGHQLSSDEIAALGEIFGTSLLFLLVLTFGVFGPALVIFAL